MNLSGNKNAVKITDLSFRDGHQSLFATRGINSCAYLSDVYPVKYSVLVILFLYELNIFFYKINIVAYNIIVTHC